MIITVLAPRTKYFSGVQVILQHQQLVLKLMVGRLVIQLDSGMAIILISQWIPMVEAGSLEEELVVLILVQHILQVGY